LQGEWQQHLAAIKLQMQSQQQQLCQQKQLKSHCSYLLGPLHLLGPSSVFLFSIFYNIQYCVKKLFSIITSY
jgi:hypothetical protein